MTLALAFHSAFVFVCCSVLDVFVCSDDFVALFIHVLSACVLFGEMCSVGLCVYFIVL